MLRVCKYLLFEIASFLRCCFLVKFPSRKLSISVPLHTDNVKACCDNKRDYFLRFFSRCKISFIAFLWSSNKVD